MLDGELGEAHSIARGWHQWHGRGSKSAGANNSWPMLRPSVHFDFAPQSPDETRGPSVDSVPLVGPLRFFDCADRDPHPIWISVTSAALELK